MWDYNYILFRDYGTLIPKNPFQICKFYCKIFTYVSVQQNYNIWHIIFERLLLLIYCDIMLKRLVRHYTKMFWILENLNETCVAFCIVYKFYLHIYILCVMFLYLYLQIYIFLQLLCTQIAYKMFKILFATYITNLFTGHMYRYVFTQLYIV